MKSEAEVREAARLMDLVVKGLMEVGIHEEVIAARQMESVLAWVLKDGGELHDAFAELIADAALSEAEAN